MKYMRRQSSQCINPQRQRGAVLAVALIMLLVLTLIVVDSGREVAQQEKMMVAQRDSHISLMAAESAIAEALEFIESSVNTTTTFSQSCTGGLCEQGYAPVDVFDEATWADGSGKYREATFSATDIGDGVQARYYIENLGTPDAEAGAQAGGSLMVRNYGQSYASGAGDRQILRIVARATGLNGTAERVVVVLTDIR